jgi:hypothetical protein
MAIFGRYQMLFPLKRPARREKIVYSRYLNGLNARRDQPAMLALSQTTAKPRAIK